MIDKSLEAELLEKYANNTSASYEIKPTAKGRDAIEALLGGESAAAIADKTETEDHLQGTFIAVEEIARRKKVCKSTVYKQARELGCELVGAGVLPMWVLDHIEKHKSGQPEKYSLDDEKIEVLKRIYGEGFKRRRNKPAELTAQYWAKQWGVSRGIITRWAKELKLLPDDYRRDWGQGEVSLLRRLAETCGSVGEVRARLKAAGYERSVPSINCKLQAVKAKEGA